MRRFLLDTGIASDFINRRHGVFEHAQHEVSRPTRSESVSQSWLSSPTASSKAFLATGTCRG